MGADISERLTITPSDPLFEHNPQPMWIVDRETREFLAVNQAAIDLYGYSHDEFLAMRLDDIRPADELERLKGVLADHGDQFITSEGWQHVCKDGRILHVDVHSHRLPYRGRDAVLGAIHDVSSYHQLATALREKSAYFQELFNSSPEAIVILDMEDRVNNLNPAFERLFGYSEEDARGRPINELIVPPDRHQEASSASRTALNDGVVERESRRCTKSGRLVDVAILGYPIVVEGEQLGIYGIYRDISERRRMVEKITYQATHDALTELYNRAEFERRANELLFESQRDGVQHALLYLDLDQFKVINDTCGHTAGDELLRQLARRLRTRVRGSDVLARLGGDEFGLLLADCDLLNAERLAEDLIGLIREFRFHWGERGFGVGVSVGLVGIDADCGNLMDVMSAADAACYTAKERGRNRLQVYQRDDATIAQHRDQMDWVAKINKALEEDRFVLFYQRFAALSKPEEGIEHSEVFIRMLDEVGNIVPPGAFIPAAERYNLMPTLDRWVIRHAFETLQRMQARGPAVRQVVSINVSGTSLSDDRFSQDVLSMFDEYGIRPDTVCFEITETAAVSDLPRAMEFIAAMRKLGSSIALDDFGSGMSSFTYLRSMDVDYLKIDGAFIRDIMRNPVDFAMAEAINRVGQVMGIRTIAEFVESDAICARLKDLGVDYAQGYAVHRPEAWVPES